MKPKASSYNLFKIAGCVMAALVAVVACVSANAAISAIALSSIASNVDSTVLSVSQVLTDTALLSGVGFTMAGLFKMHQHKQNPTQVPISTGVTLLIIGVALGTLPWIIPTVKQGALGKKGQIATVGGKDIHELIGGNGSKS